MKKIYLYLFAVLAGTSMAQIPTSGLVARYDFNYTGSQTYNFYKDATSNSYDLCELNANNSNSVTINNSGITGTSGDYCGYFNGNSGLKTCNPGNNFDTSGSISITAWIKINGFQPWNTIAVFRISDTQTPYNTINLCTGNNLQKRLGVAVSTVNNYDLFIAGNTTLTTNQWHHAACTYDKVTGVVRIYLNGILEAFYNMTPGLGLYFPSGPFNKIFSIGNIPSGVGFNGFNGNIDQVLVYTRALTATEVQNIYNASIILGIQNHEIKSINNVYPSPASNILTINSKKSLKAVVVNVIGEKVFSIELSEGKNDIDISHLNHGVYFIRTQSGETIKFVKD
jgi:hypothetical protein